MTGQLVLVTGGSGFVGVHCIVQLLQAGYRVRTTLRSLKREGEVRKMVAFGGAEADDERLTFAIADLGADPGWDEAVAGCDYVLHVASPFPANMPKDENELIVPARDGALRVLRAARDAGVKRVVLTSSFAAIGYGVEPPGRPFTEEDWSNPDGPGISAYAKSKTLAERAAWDFMASEGGALELAVVNPVGIFGPTLGPDLSTSVEIIKRMLDGELPGVPKLSFGIVDVRDVADLHLRAMMHPDAKGQRFLAVAGEFVSMQRIAQWLHAEFGTAAAKVPSKTLPDWLLRVAALFRPELRQAIPELGKSKQASHAKATRVLGWQPRSNEEAILASARSVMALPRAVDIE